MQGVAVSPVQPQGTPLLLPEPPRQGLSRLKRHWGKSVVPDGGPACGLNDLLKPEDHPPKPKSESEQSRGFPVAPSTPHPSPQNRADPSTLAASSSRGNSELPRTPAAPRAPGCPASPPCPRPLPRGTPGLRPRTPTSLSGHPVTPSPVVLVTPPPGAPASPPPPGPRYPSPGPTRGQHGGRRVGRAERALTGAGLRLVPGRRRRRSSSRPRRPGSAASPPGAATDRRRGPDATRRRRPTPL
ncbi:nascent polypeptide-associated complex subunit alpha, muscle-specific form-like [Loxodonta africana]|uniref:nascent polypeptide-associated complex subunit alpha, muscle-specific form-like n=1 Tax=Loxodonta africana TaxID=9785 RepID=UPI0030D5FEEE